jgi:Flp pilus assembly protein TadG
MLGSLIHRFLLDRRGNIAIIFALALVPIIFLAGMALDFTSALGKRTLLNAAADSAALSAVSPATMNQTVATAQTTAQNVFMGQASTVAGANYSAPTVSVTQNGLVRTATVSYSASSVNSFPNVLKQTAWPITGTATATATVPPNIDFYLLLDNSPSMNIAATTSGINTMVANTSTQGGCAFACHQSNPATDNLGNPGGVDNYTLAKNLGVVTRIQNMAAATQALMSTASSVEAASNAQYRMAIYTFNYSGTSVIQTLTSNLSTAATSAGNIDVLEVCSNNWLTCSNNNSDTDTNFESAMSNINGIMPAPGSGTAGSSPQEVLFLVTDGVDDEIATSCSQPKTGSRCQQPFNTTWCTTVKNRGILIAVLYTAYLPLPTNSWYNQWIAPFQSQIAPNMQSCASPGLYFQVTTDGDITAAMQALFEQAVAAARLKQ